MTKSLLSATVSLLLAVGVIGWQFTENAKLRRDRESLRDALTTMTQPAPSENRLTRSSSGNAGSKLRQAVDSQSATVPTDLKDILEQRDPMNRIRSLLSYVESLQKDQIGKALKELRAGSPDWDPEARFLAHMLLTRWGQEDPDAAFASLKDMDFKRSGGDASSILASLAALDPKRAVGWLNDPDNTLQHMPKMGHVLAGTIAKEWVRQDPDAAMAWASGLPDDQRHGALGGVIESLATSDPQRAAAMVMGMESDRERHGFIGEVAQSWGKRTPDIAMDWAQTLVGKEREQAVNEILDGWAQSKPSDAAAYVDALPLSERRESQISEVAREWARRDPAEAAAWLGRQEEGQGRRDSMGELMWNWTTVDPAAASSWLAEQPASESRDVGAVTLAKTVFDGDPEGAVSWAATISNEEMRAAAVTRGVSAWAKRDVDAAQAWAARNGVELPAETIAEGREQK